MIADSPISCNYTVGALSDGDMAGVLEAVTGHGYDPEEMYEMGSCIWQMRRAFSLRHCGVDGKDDTLPQRVIDELPTEEPFQDLVALYYKARGLDAQGIPLRRTLENLALEDVAEDL